MATSSRRYRQSAGLRTASRPMGPAAAFGRGRTALGVVMLFLIATAYLARPTSVDERAVDSVPHNVSKEIDRNVNNAVSDATPARTPSPGIWDPSQQATIVTRHGGAVRDARAQAVRLVGAKIASVVDARYRDTLRFELLADETEAASYAFSDGTVLITLGLARLTEYESEVAAALCESIERFVRSQDSAVSNVPVGQLSALWMQRAGFKPSDLEVLRQRIAARTSNPSSYVVPRL